uniref:Uncharacterized protein n=1 Tax=Sphaerodactylus townsendi TaxID=933632 RepID=A0ACB8FY91_9SAUR
MLESSIQWKICLSCAANSQVHLNPGLMNNHAMTHHLSTELIDSLPSSLAVPFCDVFGIERIPTFHC